MSGPVDVLETLAGWCNENGIGKAEYARRSATYEAVADLVEALDWCVSETNRDSPAVINARAAIAAATGDSHE